MFQIEHSAGNVSDVETEVYQLLQVSIVLLTKHNLTMKITFDFSSKF